MLMWRFYNSAVEYKAENFGVVGSNPIKSMMNSLNMRLITLNYLNFKNTTFFSIKNKYHMHIFYLGIYDLMFSLHLRLSQIFYATSLLDIFAYNLNCKFINNDLTNNNYENNCNIVVKIFNQWVYNFNYSLFTLIKSSITSIETLFLNTIWLEREYSELNGIFILNKNDNRNLLLQYNDSTNPLMKSFQVIGIFELFYNLFLNTIIKQKTNTL